MVVGVGVSGALVLGATNAAFTATTANPGNTFTAGTVTLSDDDAGSAMFTPSDLKPGDTYSSCIQVTYTGDLPALVKLYGTGGGTGLAPYLDLTVTRGAISSGSFGDCTNFTPDSVNYLGAGNGVIYSSTLAAFPGTYGAGVDDLTAPSVPEAWTTNETHAYRFTVVQQDTDAAQGLTATQAFTWQAADTASYSGVVLSDGPASYWKLDEISGATAVDSAGTDDGTYAGSPTLAVASGVKDAGTAVSFTSSPSGISGSNLVNPTTFSEELWFDTTTSGGGKLIGLDDGYHHDRHIYMTDAGKLVFGVYPGYVVTISSPLSYNDGAWHHVVATQGSAGMALYVDGVKVANDPTTGQDNGTDPWLIGQGTLAGWPSPPSDFYFSGSIDEVAVYDYALTQAQVTSHYAAGRP